MQENEFEKRVQQEMEEFRLRPSDAVWEKVEEQLRRKKKRRVVFFIFMLAGLSLLDYSGYFFTKNTSKQNFVQQDSHLIPDSEKSEPNNKQPVLPAIENAAANDPQPAINENQLSPAEEKGREKKRGNVLSKEKVIAAAKDIAGKHNEKVRAINSYEYAIARSAGRKNADRTKGDAQPVEHKTRQQNESVNYPVDKPGISQPVIAGNSLQDDSRITDQKNNNKVADQKVNEPIKADSIIIANSKTGEAIAATKKKQPGSKIKWGIDLSAGGSSGRNNAFSIFDMNKSLAMDYSSPGSATGGGGINNARISPSDVKAGSAFRAGLIAEIKISKRSSFISGLQYGYYSNKIQVGTYADTTVVVNNSYSQSVRFDAIYRGTSQKNYNNRFHFIQIPIQYQWQLNKGVKLPILWSIGASAGYLLATNGLVYDTTASGIYYRDNAAFNKFQLNLTTGFSLRFGSKSKVQWSLGPELSLGMNKLMKDDYTKKQYPMYGGITGRVFFQKKK